MLYLVLIPVLLSALLCSPNNQLLVLLIFGLSSVNTFTRQSAHLRWESVVKRSSGMSEKIGDGICTQNLSHHCHYKFSSLENLWWWSSHEVKTLKAATFGCQARLVFGFNKFSTHLKIITNMKQAGERMLWIWKLWCNSCNPVQEKTQCSANISLQLII